MRTLEWASPLAGISTKRWALGLAVACLSALPTSASVVNGDFSGGLGSWNTSGDVTSVSEATLGDNGEIYSYLYQAVALAPGQYIIEFDFLNLLSSDLATDPNAFPDAFFASLYFTNDLSSFDLLGTVPVDVMPLVDLESAGPVNVAGVLSPSAVGPDWTHFSMAFTNNFSYVIPTFELLDFNFASDDSAVSLDNVSITLDPAVVPVPEPATMTLLGMGLAGCFLKRKRSAKSL